MSGEPGSTRSSRPLVGVTGLPGSGKTSFAACLGSLGARVISADAVGHAVLDEASVAEALTGTFGPGIRGADGLISRSALGTRLTGRAEVDALNRIVHPYLLRRLAQHTRRALAPHGGGCVVVDAALIPEWGIGEWFDLVVFVAAPRALRHARLAAAERNVSLIDILEQCQLAEDEKRARCHVVVENVASMERLRWRGHALYEVLTHIAEDDSCSRRLWSD